MTIDGSWVTSRSTKEYDITAMMKVFTTRNNLHLGNGGRLCEGRKKTLGPKEGVGAEKVDVEDTASQAEETKAANSVTEDP